MRTQISTQTCFSLRIDALALRLTVREKETPPLPLNMIRKSPQCPQTVLTVERNVIGWFKALREGCCRKEAFPVGVIEGEVGAFYQFPVFEEPGMKIGKFDHLKERVDHPAKLKRSITKADEQVGIVGDSLFSSISFTRQAEQ